MFHASGFGFVNKNKPKLLINIYVSQCDVKPQFVDYGKSVEKK